MEYLFLFLKMLVQKGFQLLLIGTFLLTACVGKRDNTMIFPENSFQIYVSEKMETKLYESRLKKYELGPFVKVYHGSQKYRIDKIKVRGQNATDFRRKSFYINIDGRLRVVSNQLPDTLRFNKFILSAMPMDFCYMNNRFAQILLGKANLWPLQSFYTELYLNNNHQGLYLFVEEPFEYLAKKQNAECIIRRGYNHQIDQIEDENGDNDGLNIYADRFNSIYEVLPKLKGEELYNDLSKKINLDSYFKKMAIDELEGNGDYTDEIYFYTTAGKKDEIRFEILPWDYDDIFSPFPHEIASPDSACGTCFGSRVYSSVDDYLKETKGRLVFSIEDDLDFIIMKDDFLYSKYLEEMEELLRGIDENAVASAFDQLKAELTPFYQKPEIVEQSKFDKEPTDFETFTNNYNDKRTRVINRVVWLREEVKKQRMQLSGAL